MKNFIVSLPSQEYREFEEARKLIERTQGGKASNSRVVIAAVKKMLEGEK